MDTDHGGFYAFIGRRSSANADKVETLSIYSSLGEADKFCFVPGGSPSSDVLLGQFSIYREGVCDLFPDDKLLRVNQAQAYVGAPIKDSILR